MDRRNDKFKVAPFLKMTLEILSEHKLVFIPCFA